MDHMRILCLIPDMSAGGAQRAMAHLVAHLSMRHEVVLLTWEAPGTPSFYALPETVRTVQANLLGGDGRLDRLKRLLGRFGFLRRQVRGFMPHVVLSFMDTMNMTAVLANLGSGTPLVISERVDPTWHRIGAVKSAFRRGLYPLATRCVVQTERVRSYFESSFGPKLTVIANPVVIPVQQADPSLAADDGRFRIVAIGRLERQKGFDLLVEAFALLVAHFPQWDLVIFGHGRERALLEQQIISLRLQGRARLGGLTTLPAKELLASHILAFPSRYEGFPNALIEGLAAGLPAVGHSGVSGVEELIIDNETGIVVDSAVGSAGLAGALHRLMASTELRVRLGAQARRHALRWRSEIVCAKWEACLESAAGQ